MGGNAWSTAMNPNNPIIVQSDRTILLEADHPLHAEARDALAQFAELEKSPEHIHTYRLSPLSLWNAASGGMSAQEILELLTRYSKYDIPVNVAVDIREYVSRYGRVKLIREGDTLLLTSNDAALIAEIMHHKRTQPYLLRQLNRHTIQIDASRRGHIKQALIHIGFPAEDLIEDAARQRIWAPQVPVCCFGCILCRRGPQRRKRRGCAALWSRENYCGSGHHG